jgi:hypothetical protein
MHEYETYKDENGVERIGDHPHSTTRFPTYTEEEAAVIREAERKDTRRSAVLPICLPSDGMNDE